MSSASDRSFAAILSEFANDAAQEDDGPARPSIPFDYLTVAEELHSGRIQVAGEEVESLYRETGTLEAELADLLGHAVIVEDLALLTIDPVSIARELDLAHAADLDQVRRVFALANHPDRVPAQHRERASQRMQIANSLIDDAKRRLAVPA